MVVPFPPVLAFNLCLAWGLAIPLLVDFHRVLLTHALALPSSQIVHTKKSLRFYTSMHSGGLELTKLTYTRLEDNLVRHGGDRVLIRSHLDLKSSPKRMVSRSVLVVRPAFFCF